MEYREIKFSILLVQVKSSLYGVALAEYLKAAVISECSSVGGYRCTLAPPYYASLLQVALPVNSRYCLSPTKHLIAEGGLSTDLPLPDCCYPSHPIWTKGMLWIPSAKRCHLSNPESMLFFPCSSCLLKHNLLKIRYALTL